MGGGVGCLVGFGVEASAVRDLTLAPAMACMALIASAEARPGITHLPLLLANAALALLMRASL